MQSSSSLTTSQAVPGALNIKKIVIIGDGPMAMIVAIKLIQQGASDVSLVGPRLGEFTRSGDFVSDVFSKVSDFLDPVTVSPSRGKHIKDVERGLYKHLISENKINVIKGTFIEFTSRKKFLIDVDGMRREVDADLIFDCTGTKREVVLQFNAKCESREPFKVEIKRNHKHSTYAFIRAEKLSKELRVVFVKDISDKLYSLHHRIHVEAIEELRSLGWDEYSFPFIYANPLEGGMYPPDGVKANIYFQVPPGLPNDKILDFFQVILRVANHAVTSKYHHNSIFMEQHQSKKYPNKQRVSKFSTTHYQTTPALFGGDESFPMIIHCGDVSANLPFHTGASIKSGIERLRLLFANMTFSGGVLVRFNQGKYSKSFDDALLSHLVIIDRDVKWYADLTQKKAFTLDAITRVYQDAYYQCNLVTDSGLVSKINIVLMEFKRQKIEIVYNRFKDTFSRAKDEQFGFKYQHFYFCNPINDMYDDLSFLIMTFDTFPSFKINDIENHMIDFADCCKKLAAHYFKMNPPRLGEARKYYQLALQVQEQLLKYAYVDKILPLYSNLMIIDFKNRNYTGIIQLFEKLEVSSVLLRCQDSRYQSIRDKIYYHAASAYLQMLKSSCLADADRDKRFNKIKQIIGYLSADAKKEKQELESMLGASNAPDSSFDSNDALRPRFQ